MKKNFYNDLSLEGKNTFKNNYKEICYGNFCYNKTTKIDKLLKYINKIEEKDKNLYENCFYFIVSMNIYIIIKIQRGFIKGISNENNFINEIKNYSTKINLKKKKLKKLHLSQTFIIF